ncbi:hypothetical protein Salat_0916000 [Sesamum alatum]|uniref:Uncharacterized protein n=1 Tax=Sesamum alatum TaxID=300844 RepID=A0AAE2CRI8_9LAMI|nr:hypothetical protein Salat_0916000 [Sesamum alatum]
MELGKVIQAKGKGSPRVFPGFAPKHQESSQDSLVWSTSTTPSLQAPTPRKVSTSDLLSSLNTPIYSHQTSAAAAAVPLQGTLPRCRRAHLKERAAAAPTSGNHHRSHAHAHTHTLCSPLSTLRDAAAAAPPQGTRPVTVDGYNEEN